MDNFEKEIIENKDNVKVSDILNEYIDDSWIDKDDKKNLIEYIKKLYKEKYSWADSVLMKVLVKRHYNETIKGMNKLEYLKEKEEMTIDNFLEDL